MVGEPIEGYLRDEEPPDDAVVVVRGGPIAPAKVVEHAQRQAREYTYRNVPMYSISVSLTVGRWDVSALLAGPLSSRSAFAVSTAGATVVGSRWLSTDRTQARRHHTTRRALKQSQCGI